MAVAALALVAAAEAREAASVRWLVFETRLSWTRTVTITTQPNDEVECVSTARMTAQSGRFYVVKSQAKRGHFKYGSTPRASAAKYAGFSKLKVPGTARLEIGPTRCDGRPVDTTCAGTFAARLEILDFHGSAYAEDPRRQKHLNWFHRAPQPPTPPLPRPCLTGQHDRGHALAAVGLFFSSGLRGGRCAPFSSSPDSANAHEAQLYDARGATRHPSDGGLYPDVGGHASRDSDVQTCAVDGGF